MGVSERAASGDDEIEQLCEKLRFSAQCGYNITSMGPDRDLEEYTAMWSYNDRIHTVHLDLLYLQYLERAFVLA
jgi:hypothetical protein